MMLPVLLGWSGMGISHQPPHQTQLISYHGSWLLILMHCPDYRHQHTVHQYSSQACYRCSTITMVSSSLLQNSQFRILVLRLVATIIHYYSETVRAQNAASDCEFCNSQKTILLASLSKQRLKTCQKQQSSSEN